MSLRLRRAELNYIHQRVSQLLGESVWLVDLAYDLEVCLIRTLRNRDEIGPSVDSSTFLAELDGVSPNTGVVYLFTSNARLENLDPAFRRPGRIDQVIRFSRPDADLRERLIRERWPAEIVDAIPVEEVVRNTDGCNFAEVDEIRKLLVMRYLETDAWDWPWTQARFFATTKERRSQRSIGFTLPEPTGRMAQTIPTGPAAESVR